MSLIFLGENLPEIIGYLRGVSPGAPDTHVSLLDNPSGLTSGETISTLTIFFLVSVIFTILYRKLHWLITSALGAILSLAMEIGFYNPNAANNEGFDLKENPTGAIIFFISVWTMLTLVPYILYRGINQKWGRPGRITAIIGAMGLNILSILLFAYERGTSK